MTVGAPIDRQNEGDITDRVYSGEGETIEKEKVNDMDLDNLKHAIENEGKNHRVKRWSNERNISRNI